MALTRAQLLAGNPTQGTVLPGQVQAFTAGAGLQVSGTGVLSVNTTDPALNAFVRTNNTGAFNGYIWPAADGSSGYQLTTDGAGNLTWQLPAGIPWTTKGQLAVGTGANTYSLRAVGPDTSVLVADSSSATGLSYTNAILSAILLPAGTFANRPTSPVAGQVRYSTTNNEFEMYGGVTAGWNYISSMPTGPIDATTGATNKIFYQNAQIVTDDYTVPVGQNAMSAGPITIAATKTVTVSAGSSWTVV